MVSQARQYCVANEGGGACSIIYDEKKYLEKILFGHGKCDSLHCGKYCVTKVRGGLGSGYNILSSKTAN